jgi:hypothetical protein
MRKLFFGIFFALFSLPVFAAVASNTVFNLNGYLTSSGGTPASGTALFTLSIQDASNSCYFYTETQSYTFTAVAPGYFSLPVGSGSSKYGITNLSTIFIQGALTGNTAADFSQAACNSTGSSAQWVVVVTVNSVLMGAVPIAATPLALDALVANSAPKTGFVLPSSASGQITLAAPASITTSYNFTFPATTGTSGYVLSTDGTGTTSWTAPAFSATSGASGALSASASSVTVSGASNFTGPSSFASTVNVAGNENVAGLLSVAGRSAFSGKVGIGTTAPASSLDINGNVSVGSYAGVVAAPSNGMIISGNVGIGTTSPGYKVDVVGTLNATGLLVNGVAVNVGSGGSQWTSGSGGILSYASGKVGIGTTSTNAQNPNALLTVANVSSGSALSVTTNWDPSFGGGGTWIDLDANGPSGIGTGGPGTNAWIGYAYMAGAWAGDSAIGDIVYRNSNLLGKLLFGIGTGNSMMAVTGTGVGIGNSIPSALLDVSGHIANSDPGHPVVTNCGTGANLIGNDTRGMVTTGSGSVSTCTVTFSTPFASMPYCILTGNSNAGVYYWVNTTPGTMTMSFNNPLTITQKFTYMCMQ